MTITSLIITTTYYYNNHYYYYYYYHYVYYHYCYFLARQRVAGCAKEVAGGAGAGGRTRAMFAGPEAMHNNSITIQLHNHVIHNM